MLTDIRLWKRYPLLCIVRFANNTIRTTALLFFIMVISIVTTSNKVKNLPVGFIAVSLGLNWLLMVYFGGKLRRFKVWCYPVMFIINPFFNWVYMVYGIFTAGQRTWGGPRADAGAADAHVTPQQAIEHAKATGDDLNVIPETFKRAASVRHKKLVASVPLQPTAQIEGLFAPAEQLPGGWYLQNNDSGSTMPNMVPRDPTLPRMPLHPRGSFGSLVSTASPHNSVYLPQRVEDFMSEDDQRKYRIAQRAQQQPTGAYMSLHAQRRGHIYEIGDETLQKGEWSESAESLASKEEPEPYDPYILPRSRASNAHSGNVPSSRSSNFPPRRLSVELGNVRAPDLSFSTGERPHSGNPRIKGERSPLSRGPLSRRQTDKEKEEEKPSQQDEPLMGHRPQQRGSIMDRPRRHHSPPPASYRPPRQEERLIPDAASRRRSTSGDRSETDSQGKRRRAKLQKPKPEK